MNTIRLTTILPGGATFQLVQGDITAETSEAIVNAANRNLAHGAGVAGAIVRRGGSEIQAESDAWVQKNGPVNHTEPAWTTGGNLACKYVIHAVGPVWGHPPEKAGAAQAPQTDESRIEDGQLNDAVTGSLRLADELGVTSISLPALSTGVFGFPKARAAGIILKAVQRYFETKTNSGIKTIHLVLYDEATLSVFQEAWHDHFGA